MLQFQNPKRLYFSGHTYQSILNLRNNFNNILDNMTILICSKWSINSDFKTKRHAFSKYYFNEVMERPGWKWTFKHNKK